jgi:hypothetical protein
MVGVSEQDIKVNTIIRQGETSSRMEKCIVYNIILQSDQINWGEGSGICSRHPRHEKCINNLISKTEGKYHIDRLAINGRIILQWIKNTQCQTNTIVICLVTQSTGGINSA